MLCNEFKLIALLKSLLYKVDDYPLTANYTDSCPENSSKKLIRKFEES